jgi:uncharacterized membrane protein
MGFYDAFFGSDQSLYTAYAIITAIIAICITILLTATDVSVGNRILIVLFVIVTLIPSIFLTLFEITCMVTGGTEPNRWWCYAFAWVLAAFIIIYCVFVVIISLISLFTYNNAIDNVNEDENRNKLTPDTSNTVAKEIIHKQELKQAEIEKFYNSYPKELFENEYQQYNQSTSPLTMMSVDKTKNDLSTVGAAPVHTSEKDAIPQPAQPYNPQPVQPQPQSQPQPQPAQPYNPQPAVGDQFSNFNTYDKFENLSSSNSNKLRFTNLNNDHENFIDGGNMFSLNSFVPNMPGLDNIKKYMS